LEGATEEVFATRANHWIAVEAEINRLARVVLASSRVSLLLAATSYNEVNT
jgi:hypothetical protein